MRLPWQEKNWDGVLDPAGGRLGDDQALDSGNKQLAFYRLMLELIKSREIPVVFFTTPHNYKLLERYDMVDWSAYAGNLSAVVDSGRIQRHPGAGLRQGAAL